MATLTFAYFLVEADSTTFMTRTIQADVKAGNY